MRKKVAKNGEDMLYLFKQLRWLKQGSIFVKNNYFIKITINLLGMKTYTKHIK